MGNILRVFIITIVFGWLALLSCCFYLNKQTWEAQLGFNKAVTEKLVILFKGE